MNQKMKVPERIDIKRKISVLEIQWKEGVIDRICLSKLRKLCPCAICVDDRSKESQKNELHLMTDAEVSVSVEVQEVTPVGRYAFQIRWKDGHNTGIYSYAYLKELVGKRD